MSLRLKFKNRNENAVCLRIYRALKPFTKDTLPPVLAEINPFVQEFDDTTANKYVPNYYMIATVGLDPEPVVYSDLIYSPMDQGN